MKYTYEDIVNLLKGYKELKRKALQLQFEITHFTPILSDEDMIDSMTFNSTLNETIRSGQATDKTANISTSYSDKLHSINMKHKKELELDFLSVNMELERLEFYINLLEEKHSKILRLLYLEGLTFPETAEKTNHSIDTLKYNRKAAVKKLVDLYNNIVR